MNIMRAGNESPKSLSKLISMEEFKMLKNKYWDALYPALNDMADERPFLEKYLN